MAQPRPAPRAWAVVGDGSHNSRRSRAADAPADLGGMSSPIGHSSGASAVVLSRLPFPAVIQSPGYEAVLDAIKADIIAEAPEAAAVLALESELLTKAAQVMAARELALVARMNDAFRALFIATASGADLDHAAALLGVARLDGEDDEAFRTRAILGPEAFSTAGPARSYVYHALSADPDILDASCDSPSPGQVVVTILSRLNDGAAGEAMLAAAAAACSAEDVRPITDQVIVQAAEILTYAIEAEVITYPGVAAGAALEAGQARLTRLVSDRFGLGRTVTRAQIIAALTVDGVQNVILSSPAADVAADLTQAARCTGVTVTHGGVAE